ncbi:hypothetical protein JYU08_00170 [bacterium AH-315-B06]|nr:hypothetical protein [bacterium AH-315-B06]
MPVWRFLLVFGFMYSMPASVPASEDADVLRLPVDEFPLIPGNAGMRFFEGVWQPKGRNNYRITKTVTVTDKTITWDDIDKVTPYRVLAERENYVLLVEYDGVLSTGTVVESDNWTRFRILHLQTSIIEPERPPEQADIAFRGCSDDRLKNGEKSFRLPKATLRRIFATSYCRRNIGATKPPTNLSLANWGWSSDPFARITDANKGTGWIRMRRNEKILGLPPGTVPEPK